MGVVPGSGSRGKSKRLDHMVSVRLEPELLGALREIAYKRNLTLSQLLRIGGKLVAEGNTPKVQQHWHIDGAKQYNPGKTST